MMTLWAAGAFVRGIPGRANCCGAGSQRAGVHWLEARSGTNVARPNVVGARDRRCFAPRGHPSPVLAARYVRHTACPRCPKLAAKTISGAPLHDPGTRAARGLGDAAVRGVTVAAIGSSAVGSLRRLDLESGTAAETMSYAPRRPPLPERWLGLAEIYEERSATSGLGMANRNDLSARVSAMLTAISGEAVPVPGRRPGQLRSSMVVAAKRVP